LAIANWVKNGKILNDFLNDLAAGAGHKRLARKNAGRKNLPTNFYCIK
jgi:hypothetical protein